MSARISRQVLAAIEAEAAASPGEEICGLLFAEGGLVTAHSSCANVAANPRDSFEIDPVALIAAHRAARSGGPAIMGCYHSHPGGSAAPSQRDADAADPNGWLWLIVGRDGLRGWRAVANGRHFGRFDPVEIVTT